MKLRSAFLLVPLFSLIYLPAYSPAPLTPTTHYKQALEAILSTGIRLQTFLLEDPNENFIVSPISATVIIAQLILGSSGKFQKQLINLIKLPDSELHENDSFQCYDKNKEKNVTYSLPYSALHIQLANLLNALETQNSPIAKQFVLKERSALFVREGLRLKESFYKLLTMLYGSDVQGLDFFNKPIKSQQVINNWALQSTNGRISTILSSPPRPSTQAIFANAIYFLADWQVPFDPTMNRNGPFTVNSNKKVNVTYMLGEAQQIFYGESQDYRMIALPYKNEELLMYLMLPRPDHQYAYDMKQFCKGLKSNEILEMIAKAQRKDVIVKIPKMSLTHRFSILNQLKKYQVYKELESMRKPFVPKIRTRINDKVEKIDKIEDIIHAYNNFTVSNLNNDIILDNVLEDNVPLRIDDVIQQVSITVNEKGTEGAAVSFSTLDYIGGSKNFLVDRPFVFFIQHQATQATLFWGTIGNPVA